MSTSSPRVRPVACAGWLRWRAPVLVLVLVMAPGCSGHGRPGASPSVTTSTAAPTVTGSAGPTSPVPSVTAGTPTASRPASTRTTTPAPTTAAPPFPAALAGQDVERIPTQGKIAALTFDAGANADGVTSILATLASERVPATFFLTGEFVTEFPGPASRIASAEHRLGDHSIDHPHFPQLPTAQIRAEVLGAARTIRAVTGADPVPLFRFPFGDRDARTIAAVNAVGYLPVRWTVDSLGWQGTMSGTRTASFVSSRVLAAATPGAIVLMHVGANPTDHSTLDAQALPAIIAGLRQRGYRLVTLDALLS